MKKADRRPGLYNTFGEKNSKYMEATVEKIWADADLSQEENLKLRRPYDSQIEALPCQSFNLGGQSMCSHHADPANLAQGWCSIIPLGSFDPKKGGHLILWDFDLEIESPVGSTVLIPSTLITHSDRPSLVRLGSA